MLVCQVKAALSEQKKKRHEVSRMHVKREIIEKKQAAKDWSFVADFISFFLLVKRLILTHNL